MKREEIYFEALRTRDHRFDGKFFAGVKTTGIYCRPICPAKPRRENVEFFPSHLAAEKAGYRPCLRCRPESAPNSPAWIGTSAVVRRAVKLLQSPGDEPADEDKFAARFGVSARHLRRLFIEELGKTPRQLLLENRLNLARKLLAETSLPISEVAFAAGFRSIRRFNDSFRLRFHRSPSEIRRNPANGPGLRIHLPYRPPFDFRGLLHFYRSHTVGNLERVSEESYSRIVELGGKVGTISVHDEPKHSRLLLEINFPDTRQLHALISQVRVLFDLDSDPVLIANSLELDPGVKKILKKHPGIRLPSGWDPFEVGVGTILGQLVSVEQGRKLVSQLVEQLGEDSGLERDGKPVKLFPSPKKIACADLSPLKTTGRRKNTLAQFAARVASAELSLEPTQPVDEFVQNLRSIPGIGPWTASYMALKVLRHTDAFPETDLILARALELHSKETIERMSPWRGYCAALFWREYHGALKKKSKRSAR